LMKTVLDLLVNQVHEIWGAGDYMTSLFMLDITGAYDRVICKQLIHILRIKEISKNMTNWVHLFMTDRTTTLIIGDYEIKKMLISTGISQKLLLSPILYLFYAAEL